MRRPPLPSFARLVVCALWTLGAAPGPLAAAEDPAPEPVEFLAVSRVGGSGDAVVGAGIQSDGTIVLGANVTTGPFADGARSGAGRVVRLSPDGRRLLSSARVAARLRDLCVDGKDHILVAADLDGAIRVAPDGRSVLWRKDVGGICARVDGAADGHAAALRYDRDDEAAPRAGRIHLFAPDGELRTEFRGRHNTLDVCVDAASRTVIHTGWRQANAFDGKRRYPVQISYVTGRSWKGEERWHLYDWSTDRSAPAFLNRPTNNMADTRGYRCALGADGKLYCAFECAGGNHIFRWEPRLRSGEWVEAKGKKPRGDQYHEWYNSRAEHKTFFGRYDPATGEYLLGQQFAGRLSSGRTNAVRVESGALAAAADGRVLVGGTSAYGIPMSFTPPDTGDYRGGSFLLVMDEPFRRRLLSTRFQAGGRTRAIAVRDADDATVVVAGGTTSQRSQGFWSHHAIQERGEDGGGFFAVLRLSRP